MEELQHTSSNKDAENLKIINRINRENIKEFRKIPFEERALFLPQCLRNADDCKAKSTDMGYECVHCGNCAISEIKRKAEGMGYSVFIVPGGRMVYNIMENARPKGVIGVACPFELAEAMEKVTDVGIPCQGILLDKDGCRNTAVDPLSTVHLLGLNGHKKGDVEEMKSKVKGNKIES